MTNLVTAAQVRLVCGLPSNLLNDSELDGIIAIVEAKMPQFLNCKSLLPVEDIAIFTGYNVLDSHKMPFQMVLSVRSLTVGENTVTAGNVTWDEESGIVTLGNEAEAAVWSKSDKANIVKYVTGYVREDLSVSTTTTLAEVAGTNVSIALASITGFSEDGWVVIYGTDGYRETTQINAAPGGGAIQVDQLVYGHTAGSLVRKMTVPGEILELIMFEAGLFALVNVTASTYVINTSYSLGDISATKGVPYTHMINAFDRLYKRRNDVLKRVNGPRMSVW